MTADRDAGAGPQRSAASPPCAGTRSSRCSARTSPRPRWAWAGSRATGRWPCWTPRPGGWPPRSTRGSGARCCGCRAERTGDAVRITLPDGRVVDAADESVHRRRCPQVLGRSVRLTGRRPAGAEVERPAPEDVLEHGVTAEVPFETLEIAQGTPGGCLRRLRLGAPDHPPRRWTGSAPRRCATGRTSCWTATVGRSPRTAGRAGSSLVGRRCGCGSTLPTPRCAVPTLEHGDLPRAAHALRVPAGREPGRGARVRGAAVRRGRTRRSSRPGRSGCGDPVSRPGGSSIRPLWRWSRPECRCGTPGWRMGAGSDPQ